jgi:hypothetical protein
MNGLQKTGRGKGDWTASWAVFAENHVSLALGKEPSLPRAWLSAQTILLKNN